MTTVASGPTRWFLLSITAGLAACADPMADAPPTYVNSCGVCHADGLGGAPITGDVDEWERRMAKGIAKVRANAVEGFEGGTGIMPAKGGRPDLSEEEVVALVDFMVEASGQKLSDR